MEKPFLEGIRVIALTQAAAGPLMGAMLADFGAEVIKIESNARLDELRRSPLFAKASTGPNSPAFNCANYGVKSCTINLKQPKGLALFKDLAKMSDALIDNFSPRGLGHLGIDYEMLKSVKPDIVWISISGFGTVGPERDYVAYAPTADAVGGLSASFGHPGQDPAQSYIYVGDPVAAMYGIVALGSALRYRHRTGQGQFVDLALTEGVSTLIPDSFMEYVMAGRLRPRMGNRDETMAPHGCYPCQGEDKWVAIAVGDEQEWEALCGAMGQPDLAQDERFADQYARWNNQEDLNTVVAEWTRGYTHYEVMRRLQAVGVAAAPCLNLREFIDDPHVQAQGLIVHQVHAEAGSTPILRPPWALSAPRTPAPLLGEHNDYVLKGLLGLSDEAVAQLSEEKVVY